MNVCQITFCIKNKLTYHDVQVNDDFSEDVGAMASMLM